LAGDNRVSHFLSFQNYVKITGEFTKQMSFINLKKAMSIAVEKLFKVKGDFPFLMFN